MAAVVLVSLGLIMIVIGSICTTFMDVSDFVSTIGVALVKLGAIIAAIGVIVALAIASGIHFHISS